MHFFPIQVVVSNHLSKNKSLWLFGETLDAEPCKQMCDCFTHIREGEELGPQQEEGDVEIEEEKDEACDDNSISDDMPPPKATSRSVNLSIQPSSVAFVLTVVLIAETRNIPKKQRRIVSLTALLCSCLVDIVMHEQIPKCTCVPSW